MGNSKLSFHLCVLLLTGAICKFDERHKDKILASIDNYSRCTLSVKIHADNFLHLQHRSVDFRVVSSAPSLSIACPQFLSSGNSSADHLRQKLSVCYSLQHGSNNPTCVL